MVKFAIFKDSLKKQRKVGSILTDSTVKITLQNTKEIKPNVIKTKNYMNEQILLMVCPLSEHCSVGKKDP